MGLDYYINLGWSLEDATDMNDFEQTGTVVPVRLTERMAVLGDLLERLPANGVSRTDAAVLYEMATEDLGEEVPLAMYTVNQSLVNLTFATEGVVAAIASGIKAIFMAVFYIIGKLLKLVTAPLRWLLGDSSGSSSSGGGGGGASGTAKNADDHEKKVAKKRNINIEKREAFIEPIIEFLSDPEARSYARKYILGHTALYDNVRNAFVGIIWNAEAINKLVDSDGILEPLMINKMIMAINEVSKDVEVIAGNGIDMLGLWLDKNGIDINTGEGTLSLDPDAVPGMLEAIYTDFDDLYSVDQTRNIEVTLSYNVQRLRDVSKLYKGVTDEELLAGKGIVKPYIAKYAKMIMEPYTGSDVDEQVAMACGFKADMARTAANLLLAVDTATLGLDTPLNKTNFARLLQDNGYDDWLASTLAFEEAIGNNNIALSLAAESEKLRAMQDDSPMWHRNAKVTGKGIAKFTEWHVKAINLPGVRKQMESGFPDYMKQMNKATAVLRQYGQMVTNENATQRKLLGVLMDDVNALYMVAERITRVFMRFGMARQKLIVSLMGISLHRIKLAQAFIEILEDIGVKVSEEDAGSIVKQTAEAEAGIVIFPATVNRLVREAKAAGKLKKVKQRDIDDAVKILQTELELSLAFLAYQEKKRPLDRESAAAEYAKYFS